MTAIGLSPRIRPLCLALALTAFGTFEGAAQSTGTLVDVGGHRLYLNCAGPKTDGRPTVVLASSLSRPADVVWGKVQAELAKTVRVCTYDRAGIGQSDAATPRTGMQHARDLRTLLERGGERGPFVLVGTNYSGLIVRSFTDQFRSDVAGLVLADVILGTETEWFKAALPAKAEGESAAVADMRRAAESELPTDLRGIDMRASMNELKAFKPLENLPLTVIVRGKNYYAAPGIPGEVGAKLQELERDANVALAATSSNGLLMVAMKSMYALEDAPDLVIHAINQILSAR